MNDVSLKERLARRIDERADEFLGWLINLASVPSVSATGQGIRECSEILAGMMVNLGIRTEILETGGEPLVWGTIGTSGLRIVIYGHYDVQPAEESEGWVTPPFSPVVRDGSLWGRGVGDNKGQLVAHLCALAAWQDVCGSAPPLRIVFAFDGEEEIGSPRTIPFVETRPERFGGDVFLMADGSTLGIWNPSVFLEFHGLLYLELRATGAGSEWHSGSYGSILPNPILHLADALRHLVDGTGKVLVPGFYDDVIPASADKWALLAALPPDFLADPAVYAAPRFANDTPRDAMFFQPKLCVCGFDGGYLGDGVKTAVPTSARAKLDITLAPGQSAPTITRLVRQHLDAQGFGDIQIGVLANCAPVVSDLGNPYVQLVIRAIENVWDKTPTIFPSIGGGGPMAAFASHGMICIGVPYAQADLHEHSIEEHLSLEWFVNGIKTSAEIFRLLAEEGAR